MTKQKCANGTLASQISKLNVLRLISCELFFLVLNSLSLATIPNDIYYLNWSPCRVWPRLDASIHSITNCTSFHQRTCPCQRYHYTSLTSWEKGDLFWPLLLSMSSQYFSHWLWICQRATDSINSSKSLATLNRLKYIVNLKLERKELFLQFGISPWSACL